jgi:hypothetical protein
MSSGVIAISDRLVGAFALDLEPYLGVDRAAHLLDRLIEA